MSGWQHQVTRWGNYQIRAAPEALPSFGAQREAAEVATQVGTAEKTNQVVVALVTVDDHFGQVRCHVAIDLALAPLYFEDDLQALLSAGHLACLCYGCWIIFAAPRSFQENRRPDNELWLATGDLTSLMMLRSG